MLGERASYVLGPVKEDDRNTQRGIDNMNAVVDSVSLLEPAPYEAAREARHAVPGTSTTFSCEQRATGEETTSPEKRDNWV